MKLESQRSLFDIPDDVTYLNCAYMSPLMHRVRDAGAEGLGRKCRPWEISAGDFFSGSDALRDAFATLVSAEASDIAIVPSASYGISTAAANVPVGSGQNIVVVIDQFPSNVYPWRERAAAAGASVRTLERPGDSDWTDRVVDSIDDDTAVVALPHCHWTDGVLFDLERIGRVCRDRGVAFVLDVTQSAGASPISAAKIEPDFMVAATYKWLMGPYSLGLLYVGKKWQRDGHPIEHNWVHRANAENFARLVDYDDDYGPGAVRFDVGERSNFALVPAAEVAIRQILDWGVDNIAETTGALTALIAERAEALGLVSEPAHKRGSHYLALKREGGFPDDLPQALARHGVYVSARGASIRVTPHVYNDAGDVDRLIEALAAVLG